MKRLTEKEKFTLLQSAYNTLVREQFDGRETRQGQRLLAGLRDWIAEESGLDAETVQNIAEAVAKL